MDGKGNIRGRIAQPKRSKTKDLYANLYMYLKKKKKSMTTIQNRR